MLRGRFLNPGLFVCRGIAAILQNCFPSVLVSRLRSTSQVPNPINPGQVQILLEGLWVICKKTGLRKAIIVANTGAYSPMKVLLIFEQPITPKLQKRMAPYSLRLSTSALPFGFDPIADPDSIERTRFLDGKAINEVHINAP